MVIARWVTRGIVAVLLLTAAGAGAARDRLGPVTVGSYFHGPCRGLCPSFDATVHNDGMVILRIVFPPLPPVASSRMRVKAAEVAAFRAVLEPLRYGPELYGRCPPAPQSDKERFVRWGGATATRTIRGCGDAEFTRRIGEALRAVHIDPDLGVFEVPPRRPQPRWHTLRH